MEANGVTPMPAAISTACSAWKMWLDGAPYGPSMITCTVVATNIIQVVHSTILLIISENLQWPADWVDCVGAVSEKSGRFLRGWMSERPIKKKYQLTWQHWPISKQLLPREEKLWECPRFLVFCSRGHRLRRRRRRAPDHWMKNGEINQYLIRCHSLKKKNESILLIISKSES